MISNDEISKCVGDDVDELFSLTHVRELVAVVDRPEFSCQSLDVVL